ncbi:MAG: pyridoxal phosphate-dependent aminotransferase [Chitinophagales bacterium]
MLSISNKGKMMPSSPIRKLAVYAEEAKKKGTHIYHLNIGQPDIETPTELWQAVHSMQKKILEYSPSNGYESLRIKYAQYFQTRCNLPNLQADDILITTGASEALFFTLLSILDENDEVIIPEPLYANYIGFSRSGNIKVRPIATSFENGFALPSIDEFEAVINENTKAILICNPNNPTGYTYSYDELNRLKALALKHDLFIISDEVYREFVYAEQEHISLFSFEDLAQHLILVDSISKRFSACGARIGMVATKNKEVLETVLKFAQQRLSPPGLAQEAAKALFDVDKDYFVAIKKEYQQRRDTIVGLLNKIDGVACHTPNGAFYCMVQLPVADTDDFCKWLLTDFNYNGATVMLAPGSGFYATHNKGKNEVRIAYVLNSADLTQAAKCLEEALKVYCSEK